MKDLPKGNQPNPITVLERIKAAEISLPLEARLEILRGSLRLQHAEVLRVCLHTYWIRHHEYEKRTTTEFVSDIRKELGSARRTVLLWLSDGEFIAENILGIRASATDALREGYSLTTDHQMAYLECDANQREALRRIPIDRWSAFIPWAIDVHNRSHEAEEGFEPAGGIKAIHREDLRDLVNKYLAVLEPEKAEDISKAIVQSPKPEDRGLEGTIDRLITTVGVLEQDKCKELAKTVDPAGALRSALVLLEMGLQNVAMPGNNYLQGHVYARLEGILDNALKEMKRLHAEVEN